VGGVDYRRHHRAVNDMNAGFDFFGTQPILDRSQVGPGLFQVSFVIHFGIWSQGVVGEFVFNNLHKVDLSVAVMSQFFGMGQDGFRSFRAIKGYQDFAIHHGVFLSMRPGF
jgi:hypothetical protein